MYKWSTIKLSRCLDLQLNVFPVLYFDVDDSVGLKDWKNRECMLSKLKDCDTKHIIKEAEKTVELTSFPCHTQTVEGCVKLETEVSSSVIGFYARGRLIRTKLKSRGLMPSFESEKYFKHSIKTLGLVQNIT